MSDRMLNANTATAEELKGIPGVNDKIAQLILRFKEIYGVVRKEALILALRGDVSPDVLDQIDFSLRRIDDPFDLDCLPAVPKTNLLEKPMVSFKKQQMASRRSSPHESRSRSPESLNNLLEFYEKMSSPVEKNLALLKKEFSDKDELHSSRTSHTSPVNKKGDKRQLLGSRQTHTSNDRTTCGSKSTGGPSASSRVKSKLSTARDSTSRCSSGSRSPDSHRSAIKQKTTKTRKSSESRSRSPSSKKVARQQKKIKTRNSSRSRSGGRKSRLNRSYSRSSSRSKSRSGHHLKRSYRKVEKKSRSSSRSDSRSSSRSPSQSVGRGSTSRTGHHSKRKVVRKNRKSRSDSRSRSVTRHSKKSVSKHGKNKSHRRSRSTSRSSSRSSSRPSSSHSRSHKGHTRSQKMKHSNRHKKRHNSSSSTSRSSSRSPSRSRSHRTKRSKSRKSKRSSSSSSQSPSKSRSHQTKRSKLRKSKRSSSSSHSRSRSHRTKRSKSRKTKRSSSSHSRSYGRKKTRSHKSRRSKRQASSSSDSDVSDHDRHGNPRKHPKALRFDGKTNWLSFKKKFNSYRKVMKWSETESKDYLMWSLEGKALDFLTINSDIERYSFRRIVKKLEARFGVKELTETSKVKFQQASQRPDESLEDWADRVMTLATPAFVDLPEDHLKQEAIAKFSQGCCDKDAGKHACFEHPSTMEEALNLVKHHQYISQAVDGKQSKKGNDVSVNAVQSTSEDRIEQLIASALEEFANKLQVSQQPYHQLSVNRVQQSADEKWKSSVQCFFCKNFGHFKKECRIYQSWLQKQQSKADNLSDQGQYYKESTYDTYQIGKVSLLNRKNIEHQHSKESKLIDRASCPKYITDSDSMAPKPAGTNSKSRLKKRSQAKNVAVDSGTSSTKTDQKFQDGNLQGGTSSTKTDQKFQDGNLQGGTSSTKTDQKFQDGNLQGGTSSTKTDRKFQDRNLQDGTSSTKTEQKFQARNLQGGTSSTKTDQKFQDRNLQGGTSCTKTDQKFQDGNLQGGTSSTKTDRKFQDRNLQGGTSCTKTDQKFQDRNLQGDTSSTKTEQEFQNRNLQDGISSTKTEQKFRNRNLQGGTSSTKTEQEFQNRNLQDGTSSAKTEQKFQNRNLQGGTSSTKTDQKFQDGIFSTNIDGNFQDDTSSAKTVPKFQEGTSSTKTDGNLQDGTSSAETVPKFQDGTSSTKTDGNLQDGTSSAETVPKFQEGTSSTKTDGNLQDGTSSAKTVPMFQDGTSSTKTNRNLQDGTSSAKTVPKFQDGTSSTRKDKKLQDGTSSAKTIRNFQDDTYCTNTDGEFLNYKREESVYIHQVQAGSSFVQLKVGSIDVNARIDSGAEITILSSKIYEKLSKAPAKVKEVGLQMADKDTVMKGFIIQPLKMKLGNQCFSERVYVASIGDDMLLGHDLLHHLGVCLDLRTDTLIFNEEQIPVTTSFNNSTLTVARGSVKQKVRLPPNTRSRKQHQSIGRASSSSMFHRQK